jgi:cysteinyl-tRNA synthetase
MPLVLYNSLTRRKEPFEPLDPKNVRMYVCGPTVYDLAHVGNARANVAFDLLYRVLRHEYGEGHVRYVRNITDVEDKIIAAARANGEPIDALTARTTAIYREDMATLGNLPPDIEPRATEYIPQMIRMIERLIASGHAYHCDAAATPGSNFPAGGHVLFRVASYAKYGALSRRSRADQIAGARVEVAPYKEDPGDFVLWKPSTPDQPGWDSPWGRGRPGWHIECSAMSEETLGPTFDIHGGGLDLIFPHHENEIAQSVCAHDGHPFARYWLHNGMLTVGGAKMAKSEGNFVTVRDALAEAPGEVIRLALLGTHYRDPLDWTPDRLHQAKQTLARWYRALSEPGDGVVEPDKVSQRVTEIAEALQNDLNSPLALSKLHTLARWVTFYDRSGWAASNQEALRLGGGLMGLLQHRPEDWFHRGAAATASAGSFTAAPGQLRGAAAAASAGSFTAAPGQLRGAAATASAGSFSTPATSEAQIETQIQARAQARKERRFADADRIRQELASEGVILEDKPDGTTDWRRA